VVVRIFFKTLLVLGLGLLLLLVLGVLTLPLWGPPLFTFGAGKVLQQAGCSEVVLRLESIGLRQLQLELEHLRFQGLTLADARLRLDYTPAGLWAGELEQLTLSQPRLELDLGDDWPASPAGAEAQIPLRPEWLPVKFPVKAIHLEGAVLTVRGADWERRLEVDARLAGQELLEGDFMLRSDGLELEARGELQWADWSGRVNASARLDPLAAWLEFGRQRAWYAWPKGLSLTAGPVEIEAAAAFAAATLEQWHAQLRSLSVQATMDGWTLSLGQINADISATEPAATLELAAELLEASVTAAAAGLESERLNLSLWGTWPNSLAARLAVTAGRATWSGGGGVLSGLEGTIEMASLSPLAGKGPQTLTFTSIQQGDFSTGAGELQVNYTAAPTDEAPLQLELATHALGGKLRILAAGQSHHPLAMSLRVLLDSVRLEDIARLFPQFDGRIEGVGFGELSFRLAGKQILLQPGGLQMLAGSSGRFAYQRQGWLTQDPQLDPAAFIRGRTILEIMQDRLGAPVLTELALRDLEMTDFRLLVEQTASGRPSLVAKIIGERTIKGVTVPVVLDVPIRGDVQETLDAVFEFNARM